MAMPEIDQAKNPLVVLKHDIELREGDFRAALPKHIPSAKFIRVILTAISVNPKLAVCDRRSLLTACMRAAKDGLLPDGSEAAIVEYDGKAQYQPMIAGIRKLARQSGEILTWQQEIVYQNDAFDYELGDEPRLTHKPAIGERGQPVMIYSIAKLSSGELSREVMSVTECNDIRDRYSKAWKAFKAGKIKSTPWHDSYGEMLRKTVAHRHSKVLPMSTDLEAVFAASDEAGVQEIPAPRGRPRRLGSAAETIDRLLEITEPKADDGENDNGEETERQTDGS
jgi:recombination protein RecT